MTAGKGPASGQHRPHHPQVSPHSSLAFKYLNHASAQWTNTDAIVTEAIRAEYPQLHLTVVPVVNCSLIAFTGSGQAKLAQIDKEHDRLGWMQYFAPARRMSGGRGALVESVKLGKFLLEWNNKEFVVYIADGRDGNESYPQVRNQYILSPSIEATNELLLTAGQWNSQLHNEVWVFDGGFWAKDPDLWQAVQKASWDDVILDPSMKKAIISDVETFFDSRDQYERLRVPWKRGIIYYGPPGNGKTISIKAMMHDLYARNPEIPTLYVKTLSSFGGPEYSIGQIFGRARREAPCYLVFEDLDSIVSDDVRSYFLNAVDGIQRNDGIMMVGSTNHLDRLDPGIAKRPSRFDRKYFFDNPNEDERTAYLRYWKKKLDDNENIEFPDKICGATAKITKGFSFAYLQEAMVASLLAIARHDDEDDGDDDDSEKTETKRMCLECMKKHSFPASGSLCQSEATRPFKGLFDWVWSVRRIDEEDPDLDQYILWRELKKQIRILREELHDEKKAK